jgi:hypothetical protein
MKRLLGGGSLITELEDGEEDNSVNARQWEAEKGKGLVQGRHIARSRGGREIMVGH